MINLDVKIAVRHARFSPLLFLFFFYADAFVILQLLGLRNVYAMRNCPSIIITIVNPFVANDS